MSGQLDLFAPAEAPVRVPDARGIPVDEVARWLLDHGTGL